MLNYCANGPSGYNLTNSLRFRSSASAYLNRTPASAGNRQTFTVSVWVKRGTLGVDQKICSAYGGTNDDSGVFDLRFSSADVLYVGDWSTGLTTSAVFRDPSAWYHVVMAVDTTQATGSNRIKVYVNGVQQTLNGTAFVQNVTTPWNNSVQQNIGRNATLSNTYFDGYLAEFYNIDGQALTPSSFGSTNSTTGVWQPAKYTGTYGTNGFYLPFSPNATSSYAAYSSNLNANYNSLPLTGLGTNFQFTGDFTIEGWVLYPTSGADGSLYVIGTSTYLALNIDTSSGNYNIYTNTSTPAATFASGIPLNEWTHVAMVRSGSTITLYTNGVPKGTLTNSSTLGYATSVTYNRFGGDTTIARYTSNFRIVKSAVYTSKFVPPTAPLTSIANTLVLTFQNSSAIDNSPNAWTVSTTGTVTYPVSYPFTANIAADASGNANNWTPNNIQVSTSTATTYDSMTDVPTLTSATVANYAVLNPLASRSVGTMQNGNLTWKKSDAAGDNYCCASTMSIPSSGKWYWEITVTDGASGSNSIGIIPDTSTTQQTANTQPGAFGITTNAFGYYSDGNKYTNGSGTAYGNSYTTGDVIGIAVDTTNGKIWWSKNGTFQASGDPAAGTNAAFTTLSGSYYAASSVRFNNNQHDYNFGQRPFSYTPPTGYVALNTYNLPTSTIVQGNKYMDATLYTGNGSTQTITNAAGFQPDLVWQKPRSEVASNRLVDSVRGVNKVIYSNQTASETTETNTLTSFNSNGFTGGGSNAVTSGNTAVAWQWQAGQGSTSSNTSGSITSTVSVNASAGFSIVTYTGTGANATVGHGLGVAPKMIIVKPRNAVDDWIVYHASTGANQYLVLNSTVAAASLSTAWNNTSPTSSVFSLGTTGGTNGSGRNFVAYCWAEIAGFSKFGSYTGNGSADGPFVYLGFRPKWIIIRPTNAISSWTIEDTARSTYNVMDARLFSESTDAEVSNGNGLVDYLSNGFKPRVNHVGINGSGNTYIYAAFAEHPFKNSLAR